MTSRCLDVSKFLLLSHVKELSPAFTMQRYNLFSWGSDDCGRLWTIACDFVRLFPICRFNPNQSYACEHLWGSIKSEPTLVVVRADVATDGSATEMEPSVPFGLDEECQVSLSASTRSDNCPLLPPVSDTKLAIWPQGSFQVRSGYWNSAPLMCAPRMGKNIGTRGSYMSFDACERRKRQNSVPFPRLGILGAVDVVMLYMLIICFLDEK